MKNAKKMNQSVGGQAAAVQKETLHDPGHPNSPRTTRAMFITRRATSNLKRLPTTTRIIILRREHGVIASALLNGLDPLRRRPSKKQRLGRSGVRRIRRIGATFVQLWQRL